MSEDIILLIVYPKQLFSMHCENLLR
jgi:hypothetical protein